MEDERVGKELLGKREREDDESNSKRQCTWPAWVLEANSGKQLKLRKFKEIIPFKQIAGKQRGGIRVLSIYNRFAKVTPELKKWPSIEGYERFNVCKNNKYQELSPMVLGPAHDENGEFYAFNIEDAWQCSKVFQSQINALGCTVESMEWLNEWSEWSKRGRHSKEARRHRTPKTTPRDRTLFSYYTGDKLGYVEARKRMYCRWYEQLAVQTKAYADLKARHLSGVNLILLEYDGLDRENPEENKDLNRNDLTKYLNDPSRPFGHALVLACLLLDLSLWD